VYPLALTDLATNTYLDISLLENACASSSLKAVRSIRSLVQSSFLDLAFEMEFKGVGGLPARCQDFYSDFWQIVPAWIGILLGSTFLVLLCMTRSIVVPLKAILVSLMSLGGALGMLIALFPNQTQRNVETALNFKGSGFVDAQNVIFIFSIAYGLTIDYEVFLISRIMEEYYRSKRSIKQAIVVAMVRTGPLISSAATMLGIVVFAFIGSEVLIIKEIGVGVALSVVLDATFVRIFLVPSFLMLMGDSTWYCPQWLLRLVDASGLGESEEWLQCADALEKEHIHILKQQQRMQQPAVTD